MLFGQNTGHHIYLIGGSNGYKDVSTTNVIIIHGNRAGAVGLNGQNIQTGLNILQAGCIVIHHNYVIFFLGKAFSNGIAQLSRANYNDSHDGTSYKI